MNSFKKTIIFLSLILFFSSGNISYAENIKTILIVTDELDFTSIKKLDLESEISLGLMNTRTSNVFNRSSESYFMTIATGRRVELEKGLYKGLKKDENGNITIIGYDDIIEMLDENYKDFSKNMDFLADVLKSKNISIGYLGNSVSSLIAADKNGTIYNGYIGIEYDEKWLIKKTSDLLKKSDVIVVSYDIAGMDHRLSILKDYIEEYSMYNIMLFPSKVSGDVNDIRNGTLVPILYNCPNNSYGMLTSHSTKRQGLVTNMDIFSELANIYKIETNTSTGHEIYSEANNFTIEDLIEENKNNLEGILNLIVIKYIFHGIVVLLQLYIIYDIYKRKNNFYVKYKKLIDKIIIMILMSLVLGIFNLNRNIILYCLVLISSTILVSFFMEKLNLKIFPLIPILTNIAILFAIFFYPNMIYNSFYGFNNLVSGGRFYGLNNETMGILIATGIITFFWLKRKTNNKILSTLILCLYFPVIILALSERYATNFGGYLTSIAAFLMLFYMVFFKKKLNKKNIIVLCSIGFGIFMLGFIMKIGNSSAGHAESLYSRIVTLGIYELVDMVRKKLKQLFLIAISPPWSIIILAQLYFFKKFFASERGLIEKVKIKKENKYNEILIIIITSIFAFLLNDTGAIAFVYINTYTIAMLIHLYYINRVSLQ